MALSAADIQQILMAISADPNLGAAISAQIATQVQANQGAMAAAITGLTQQLAAQPAGTAAATITATVAPDAFQKPFPFKGKHGLVAEGFITSVELWFQNHATQFPGDQQKVTYTLSLFQDDALAWGYPIQKKLTDNPPVIPTWIAFKDTFINSFGTVNDEADAQNQIEHLRQGSSSVAEYAAAFKILADRASYNDPALRNKYKRGLNDQVKNWMVGRMFADFEAYRQATIVMGNELEENKREAAEARGQRYVPHSPTT